MYTRIIFTLVAVTMLSCGSIKKLAVTREQLENSKSMVVVKKENQSLEQTRSLRLIDTSSNYMEFEIIPIGQFSLSATNGFTGKASMVTWKGTATGIRQVALTEEMAQSTELAVKQVEKNSIKQNLSTRERTTGKIQVIWLIIILVTAYLAWRWWKYRRG